MRKFQRELFGATVTIVPTGTIVEIISRSQAFGSGGGYTRRTLFGEVALGEFIADASASNDFTVARKGTATIAGEIAGMVEEVGDSIGSMGRTFSHRAFITPGLANMIESGEVPPDDADLKDAFESGKSSAFRPSHPDDLVRRSRRDARLRPVAKHPDIIAACEAGRAAGLAARAEALAAGYKLAPLKGAIR